MSKETKELKAPKQNPWYKSVALPWIIILVIAVSASSFISGYFFKGSLEAEAKQTVLHDMATIKAAAPKAQQ